MYVKGAISVSSVDINDISKGAQTNDVKITLDGESLDINDISKGAQTNDVKITLDGEAITETNSSNIKTNLDTIKTDIASILLDTTAIKTAVQIIDDWDDSNKAKVDQQPISKSWAIAQLNASGTVIAGSMGVKIRIYKIYLNNQTTGYCTFDLQNGSGGTTKFFYYLAQGGSVALDLWPGYIELSTNTALYCSFGLIPSPRGNIMVLYEYI